MAKFQNQVYSGSMNPFWRQEVRILPGGFKLAKALPVGTAIKRGAYLAVDFATMQANIVKIGKVIKGGTQTSVRVSKNSYLQVGDYVMKLGAADKSTTVKAIDSSNDAFDVITLTAALTGVAENDFIQECNPKGGEGTTPEPLYVANAVVGADTEYEGEDKGFCTVSAAYDCVILKGIAGPIPDAWLVSGGFCLAANPNIKFINQ